MKKYDQYKNSGVEWLGEIPEHWKIARLKNIIKSKITDGPHTTPEFIKNGIPFLSVDGIQDGELVFENCRKISLNDHIKFQKKCKIEKFDILMGKAASIGKIAQAKVDFEFSIWSPLALIKPKLTIINSTFLEYYLKSTLAQYQIEILCTSNTQKNISMDDIPKIISTLPPLSEQEKIANFLDDKTTKIDQSIAIKKKQIELLKERRQILIHKAVTRGLNDNVKLKNSGVEWIGEIPEHWEILPGFRVYKENKTKKDNKTEDVVLSLSYGNIVIKPKEKLTGLIPESFDTYQKVKPGDIIIRCMDLQNDQKSLRTGIAKNNGIITNAYLNLNIINGNNSDYIYNFLHSLDVTKVLYKFGTGLRQNLSYVDFKRLKIPVPPLTEQEKIVDFIDLITKKITNAISLKEQEIERLREYKMSLIDGVVTGKVKVC